MDIELILRKIIREEITEPILAKLEQIAVQLQSPASPDLGDEIEHLEFLTVEMIRKTLGVGLNQAYKLINSGEIPALRIGRKIIVSKADFYEWLNKK